MRAYNMTNGPPKNPLSTMYKLHTATERPVGRSKRSVGGVAFGGHTTADVDSTRLGPCATLPAPPTARPSRPPCHSTYTIRPTARRLFSANTKKITRHRHPTRPLRRDLTATPARNNYGTRFPPPRAVCIHPSTRPQGSFERAG